MVPAKAHGKLDFAVDGIVLLDAPSQKSDDDHRRSHRRLCHQSFDRRG
jgi:hypothetical protein